MSYDFRSQDNYGGFNPNESQGSANQRGGYNQNYNGASGPYGNPYYAVDKRTDSLTMFNDGGIMMKCSLINDKLSITMATPTIDPATGKPKYAKDNRVSTMLTPERLVSFAEMIGGTFIDKMKAGDRYNFGVWTNKEHSTFVCLNTDSTGESLIIHTGINNASGGLPTKSVRYDFKEEPIVEENYDQISGSGSLIVMKAQFVLFCKLVNAAVNLSFKTCAQEVKDGMRYEMNKIESDMNSILTRLGGVPADVRSNAVYSPQASNGYMEAGYADRAMNTQAMNTPVPTELDSLNDLPF